MMNNGIITIEPNDEHTAVLVSINGHTASYQPRGALRISLGILDAWAAADGKTTLTLTLPRLPTAQLPRPLARDIGAGIATCADQLLDEQDIDF